VKYHRVEKSINKQISAFDRRHEAAEPLSKPPSAALEMTFTAFSTKLIEILSGVKINLRGRNRSRKLEGCQVGKII
jgi:hypothetical protein